MKTSCFWSLLSLDEMKFIYIPSSVSDTRVAGHSIGNLLLHHSLYEFMHPNETALAKFDLSSFLKLNTLAGSVTRCRLLSFQSIAEASSYPNCGNMQLDYLIHSNVSTTVWNILDLVVYTATHDTVLVFFHNSGVTSINHTNVEQPRTFGLSCCQGYSNFTTQDTMQLSHVLKEQDKKRATLLPLRLFQIVNQHKKPLFVWPPKPHKEMTELVRTMAQDMILKEFKSSSFTEDGEQEDISCTRHFYATTKIVFVQESCLFQRILIPYGNIFFESFQISPAIVKPPPANSLYQHYYMNPTLATNIMEEDPTHKRVLLTYGI
ncbi:hypothetical protein INT47_010867 [Mucor saturninus]|uniref:Uncharacterized protein n=1 Tax=Mucor saturninus TaxID=64648 RepID=A0A8H7RDU5_9FUNG|nr:hypothetical protein INT47_010867 [Mucor saturninus]